MSRYKPLADFLSTRAEPEWDADFAEIERLLGAALPQSARTHPAWWANQSGPGHSQTHGWRSVGWRTCNVDVKRGRVRFVRDTHAAERAPQRVDAVREGEGLYAKARELTGIADRDRLVDEGLKALIEREAGRRLARLGGSMPGFRPPARERP